MPNPSGANGYGDRLGWVVGVQEWLDSEASKVARYWRAIEYGSNYWVDKTIVGLWTDTPGSNDRPNRLINGQEMTAMGRGDGEKFAPFFARQGVDLEKAARAALWYYFGGVRGEGPTRNIAMLHTSQQYYRSGKKAGQSKGDPESMAAKRAMFFWFMTKATPEQMPFVSARVGQAIPAGEHYQTVIDTFPMMERELALLREGLATMMQLPPDITNAHGIRQIRRAVAAESDNAQPRSGALRSESRGPAAGAISVRASANVQDIGRTARAFSHSYFRQIIVDINTQMASEVHQRVIEQMENAGRTRPATGDLMKATADRRNRLP